MGKDSQTERQAGREADRPKYYFISPYHFWRSQSGKLAALYATQTALQVSTGRKSFRHLSRLISKKSTPSNYVKKDLKDGYQGCFCLATLSSMLMQ